tara:strand:+ start:528 stop:998 length:471 start_codon:yes stop_codon:yes gene_type:complete
MNTYFKTERNIKYLLKIKRCFPDIVHIRHVDKELIIIYLGDINNCEINKDGSYRYLTIEDYKNLPTNWLSTIPDSVKGEVHLHTFQQKPIEIRGANCYEDIVATSKMDYRTALIIFRGTSFGQWGDEIKNQRIVNRDYTDEENEKFFKLLRNDSYF